MNHTIIGLTIALTVSSTCVAMSSESITVINLTPRRIKVAPRTNSIGFAGPFRLIPQTNQEIVIEPQEIKQVNAIRLGRMQMAFFRFIIESANTHPLQCHMRSKQNVLTVTMQGSTIRFSKTQSPHHPCPAMSYLNGSIDK